MSDNKKYYYLKLKDNFFDSDSMIIMESMQDGYKYSNILLKLYLRSLKNEGKLMFNDRIPYNSTILAQVTRHSVGDVENAVKVYQELGLIEVLDTGAIYITDIQNFIGESSTEADRKRAYRNRIDAEKKNNPLLEGQKSDKCPDKSPPELEIELKIEKEIDKKQKKKKFGEFSNVLLTEQEFEKLKEKFPHDYLQRIERVSGYVASTGKSYKSHYATIISWARKDEQNAPQKKVVNSDWEKQMQELME